MSNPLFSRLTTIAGAARAAGTAGADAAPRTMTRIGTANKAILLLLLCAFSASLTWWQLSVGNSALLLDATLIGLGGGFAVALAVTFIPRTAPALAPIYAVLEGLALGALSWLMHRKYPGVPQQAVITTFIVAMTVFVLYKTELLQATARFRRVVVIATVGIAAFYLVELILAVLGVTLDFGGHPGWLAVAVNVVIAGVAALNLVLNFDDIDRAAAAGAPKAMEWYGAFSLLVTLVWLYLEILRLLGSSDD